MGQSQIDDAGRERAAGIPGRRSAPSVHLPRSRSGQFAFFSIARDAFGTVHCSIWQSTASFAAATWSISGFAMWSPDQR